MRGMRRANRLITQESGGMWRHLQTPANAGERPRGGRGSAAHHITEESKESGVVWRQLQCLSKAEGMWETPTRGKAPIGLHMEGESEESGKTLRTAEERGGGAVNGETLHTAEERTGGAANRTVLAAHHMRAARLKLTAGGTQGTCHLGGQSAESGKTLHKRGERGGGAVNGRVHTARHMRQVGLKLTGEGAVPSARHLGRERAERGRTLRRELLSERVLPCLPGDGETTRVCSRESLMMRT
jgi:hypothetical protein